MMNARIKRRIGIRNFWRLSEKNLCFKEDLGCSAISARGILVFLGDQMECSVEGDY
jgi:hypothetical protein